MVMLVTEPGVEERLIAERQAAGIDHHDEVWEGVYVVSPIANNDHQWLVGQLTMILQTAIGTRAGGTAYPGVNVSDQEEDWRQNYRVPDVAVFLKGNRAQDRGTHWFGGPDFAVEIVSPGDKSHEKLPFYAAVGVRELLIVDRAPWSLELYRLESTQLVSVGRSTIEQPSTVDSQVFSLRFRLVPGTPRPQIEITHRDGRQQWLL
jgi:Uma2 family endonuclease